jgi:hypothetical protein
MFVNGLRDYMTTITNSGKTRSPGAVPKQEAARPLKTALAAFNMQDQISQA